jgi:AP-3 complex subunit beta
MESLSRISSVLETARDLTLEAAQSASAAGRTSRRDGKQLSSKETRKLLNSRMDREVLDGLQRVITVSLGRQYSGGFFFFFFCFIAYNRHLQMMSRGTDCSEFFADVVKNVASPTLEIKKLVYIYLLRYAESEPDLALLSINTIQKALNDQNQVVRAMAIRVMSGIRVPVISQIVALAIKKGVTDMSAYVRKCAALAIPKCYKLDPTTMPQLLDHLGALLGDKSHYVMGAAVMAFLEICPDRYDLIHPHYRSLVKMLIDMDEWGQLAMLRLLTGYARKCFPLRRQKKQEKQKEKATNGDGGFYSDEEVSDDTAAKPDLDPDLGLLLRACPPLLQSRNSAVRTSLAKCMSPPRLKIIPGYRGCCTSVSASRTTSTPQAARWTSRQLAASTRRYPAYCTYQHCFSCPGRCPTICAFRDSFPCSPPRSTLHMDTQARGLDAHISLCQHVYQKPNSLGAGVFCAGIR